MHSAYLIKDNSKVQATTLAMLFPHLLERLTALGIPEHERPRSVSDLYHITAPSAGRSARLLKCAEHFTIVYQPQARVYVHPNNLKRNVVPPERVKHPRAPVVSAPSQCPDASPPTEPTKETTAPLSGIGSVGC